MLTLFGIRRQSKLDKEDYKVYACDLEKYDLDDIDLALQKMVKYPRLPGETPFPEVALFIEAIRSVRVSRMTPTKEMQAYERRIETNPEEFVRVSDVIREVMDKRRREGKPVWDTKDPRRGDSDEG